MKKLICLVEAEGLRDGRRKLMRQLTITDAENLLARRRKAEAASDITLQHGRK